MGVRYAEKIQIVPIWAPQASTAADLETAHVKVKNAQWVSFLCGWGALTTDGGDGVIKVYSSPLATTANAVSQSFSYRLSSAVGVDNWGDITTVDSTATAGAPIGDANENMFMLIDVDPASVVAADADAEYVHLLIDGSNLATNPSMSVVAFIEPRYPQNENLTSS
jgi:hypothetical protein